jgi:hypothetical protein
MSHLETDYLIVGAGAVGLAFADMLLSEAPNATIAIVDERAAPGGHWVDAYDFVSTHQPSALYGVDSTPLGQGRIDRQGLNAGHSELATGAEIRAYFADVMQRVLLGSGRVTYFASSHYDFETGVLTTNGATHEVRARRVVDSTYNAGTIPLRHTPSYTVAPNISHGPVNDLARAKAERYVVIGAGKTGMDACVHLLGRGVAPDAITWIMPQDVWFYNRAHYQPGDHCLDTLIEGLAAQTEISANAQSAEEVLLGLERAGVLMRIDPNIFPTAYRCATVTRAELDEVRRVANIVRLGRVKRIEANRIVLDRGEIPTDAETFHIDCSAKAVEPKPVKPVFDGDRITLQFIYMCQPPFCSALIALVEANYEDEAKKNQLCTVIPSPERAIDWLSMSLQTRINSFAWMQEPKLAAWLATSRLNSNRALMRHKDAFTPAQNAARTRARAASPAAVANLQRLLEAAHQ